MNITISRKYGEPIEIKLKDGFFETISPQKILLLHWYYRLTQSEIADLFNLSRETINHRIQKYNIPVRNHKESHNLMSAEKKVKNAVNEKIRAKKIIKRNDLLNVLMKEKGIPTEKELRGMFW